MSSASLKSLMAAKKASSVQRITHPFASYDRQSRLTCTLCPATVLKHDNLWGAHLISKGHRVNAQRYEREQQALREREEAAAVAAAAVKGKRKRSQSAEPVHDESNNNEKGKRAREGKGTQQSEDDNEDGPADENRTSALPDDFFTDPSQVPTRSTLAQDDAIDPTPTTAEEDDPEWAAFEASLQQDVPKPTTTITTTSSTAKATIFAAPVAYEFGAPKVAEEGEEEGEPEEEEEETDEERLERLEREQAFAIENSARK
ncbi:BQ5605_C009g05740 [Microbotryum silenes-dioicae]|uniref:BQ5605_C009g05740 protein n=1 Tax=Microbotryum silenes-dioicae TaxID=796604 RepID=A0A2X0PFB3_9BASI|nr:BQ5605_C009g05740 [Microbotryum silenes-dioicae]